MMNPSLPTRVVSLPSYLTRCLWHSQNVCCTGQIGSRYNRNGHAHPVGSDTRSYCKIARQREWIELQNNGATIVNVSKKWIRCYATAKRPPSLSEKIESARKQNFARTIAAVVKEHNNKTDPAVNKHLAHAIEELKTWGIPEKSINNSIKAAPNTVGDILAFDLQGGTGLAFIVQLLSDKHIRCRHDLESYGKKNGLKVLPIVTQIPPTFEYKGVIEVPLKTYEAEPKVDKYVDVGIEAGAEDVTIQKRDGKQILKFICDPGDFTMVAESLDSVGYKALRAGVDYVPTSLVTLQEHQLKPLKNFMDKVLAHESFLNMFHNIDEGS